MGTLYFMLKKSLKKERGNMHNASTGSYQLIRIIKVSAKKVK